MPTKTIKLYFHVTSETESTPTDIELSIDGNIQKLNLDHTFEWNLESDESGARPISIDVDSPEYTEDSEIPRVDLSIKPTRGSVILVHAEQNYTFEYGEEQEDGTVEITYTESKFSGNNIGIISQPLVDNQEDTNRYDFSMHNGLGYGGGDDGMGNLPIRKGEVVSFTLGYDFYRIPESETSDGTV